MNHSPPQFNSDKQNKEIIVIGAGIVGVATALWLRRFGCKVTLIDRKSPGMETSFGNAGILAACACVPVTVPGLIGNVPKYLLNPNSPLFLRWQYLPKLLPFLMRYLANANAKDTPRIAEGICFITHDCVKQHYDLAGNTSAGKFIKDSAYAFAYESREAFAADHYVWDLRAKLGFHPQIIEGTLVQKYQPHLSPKFKLLALMHDHGFILNPGGYVQSLADVFCDMGGKLIKAEVTDFSYEGGHISAVSTDQGEFSCDHAVLATGAFSKPLLKKAGLNIPLEAERGYHILFENYENGPSIPIYISTGKFVATPMEMGLRCAGVVEFGGLEASASKAPLEFLRKQSLEAFPHLRFLKTQTWLGHRPATTDSLPVIGEIANTGLYAAFGHQHIGLTGSAKTGRLVAEMICDIPTPNIDIYSPSRF